MPALRKQTKKGALKMSQSAKSCRVKTSSPNDVSSRIRKTHHRRRRLRLRPLLVVVVVVLLPRARGAARRNRTPPTHPDNAVRTPPGEAPPCPPWERQTDRRARGAGGTGPGPPSRRRRRAGPTATPPSFPPSPSRPHMMIRYSPPNTPRSGTERST